MHRFLCKFFYLGAIYYIRITVIHYFLQQVCFSPDNDNGLSGHFAVYIYVVDYEVAYGETKHNFAGAQHARDCKQAHMFVRNLSHIIPSQHNWEENTEELVHALLLP